MILPISILLLCQLLGETTARGLALPIPGPVLGMAVLLIGFAVIPRLPALMMPTAQGLLGHLSLLFVPAAVGVVSYIDILGEVGGALFFVIVASTALALVASAVTFVVVAHLCGDDGASSSGEPQP